MIELLHFKCEQISSLWLQSIPTYLTFGSLNFGIRLFDLSDCHTLLANSLLRHLHNLSMLALLPHAPFSLSANLIKILDEAYGGTLLLAKSVGIFREFALQSF